MNYTRHFFTQWVGVTEYSYDIHGIFTEFSTDIDDETARVVCLIEVLKQLPPANTAIISRLFRLLYTIQIHSETNKMVSCRWHEYVIIFMTVVDG